VRDLAPRARAGVSAISPELLGCLERKLFSGFFSRAATRVENLFA
jgi:hypothetical protein